ncbi:MAG: GNAT family N-acetyltransferase [Candidatus Zixiibacteriota bacterium]
MEASHTFLRNNTVLLRRWTEDDAEWYVNSRDEEIFKWTTEKRGLTVEEARESIAVVNSREDVSSFAIIDRTSDSIVGNIALVTTKENRHIGEAMYWLAPEGRGKGFATFALRLLCEWAFRERCLDKVILKTHIDNRPSQLVAERAGFHPFKGADGREDTIQYQWYRLVNTQ